MLQYSLGIKYFTVIFFHIFEALKLEVKAEFDPKTSMPRYKNCQQRALVFHLSMLTWQGATAVKNEDDWKC